MFNGIIVFYLFGQNEETFHLLFDISSINGAQVPISYKSMFIFRLNLYTKISCYASDIPLCHHMLKWHPNQMNVSISILYNPPDKKDSPYLE